MVGRTTSKEQYAFIYDSAKVLLVWLLFLVLTACMQIRVVDTFRSNMVRPVAVYPCSPHQPVDCLQTVFQRPPYTVLFG